MRVKTPQRLGSPPDEIGAPGEICPLGAVCAALQDMLSLKYGQQLDEADFLGKAKVRVEPALRSSPAHLAQALNSEPALRVKDIGNGRLLQLQVQIIAIDSFAELQAYVRRWPGTACAVASVAQGISGRRVQLVAAYREAYGEGNALVGKTFMKATGRPGPLHTFQKDGFVNAVILDPVIVRVLKYESDASRMLDLQIPEVSVEYNCVHKGHAAETELVLRTCGMMVDLAPTSVDSALASAAAQGCSFVLDLMSQHFSNPAVQAGGCRVLRAYMPVCSQSLSSSEAQAAVEMVTAGMRKHSLMLDVQEAGCAVLAGAGASRPELQSIIANSGGIDQVVVAMRNFPDAAELQTWACGAIASLSANNPMNQAVVAGSKGIDEIIGAMERHAHNDGVQHMACGALGNLAANHKNNQGAITALGGPSLILGAMRAHPDSVRVQLSAIAALWCFMKNSPEIQSAVARANGTELIVTAVQRHSQSAELRSMASGALQVLVPGLSQAMVPSAPASGGSTQRTTQASARRMNDTPAVEPRGMPNTPKPGGRSGPRHALSIE